MSLQKFFELTTVLQISILKLTKKDFDLTAKFKPIDGLEAIPDCLIEVRKASKENFDYRLQINDYSYF